MFFFASAVKHLQKANVGYQVLKQKSDDIMQNHTFSSAKV